MTLTKIASTGVEDSLRWVLGANGTSDYTFTGPGLTGTVNDPTIYLTRGQTYIFQNNSGGHPFYIKTSIANGGTNDAYNTGVTNNGGGNGTEIVFTVPHDSPDILYYQCSSHASMAGQFNIAGSVADGSISTAKLADDAVTQAKLANNAVTTAEINNLAVTTAKLNDAAVTTAKISDNAVTTQKIANNAVTNAKVASGAISSATIIDANVTEAKIADDAVTTQKIAANAITTNRIADQAVTLAKLPHGTSSNDGKFLRANNGADPTFETVSGTTINNNADNRVITGSGTANTLEAESSLTFDGTQLNSTSALFGSGNVSKTQDGVIIQRNSSSGSAEFVAGRSGGNYGQMQFYVAGASGVTNRHQIDYQSNFLWYDEDGSTEMMRLHNDGKVGINESSPSKKLQITSTTSNDGVMLKSGSSNYLAYAGNTNRTTEGQTLLRIESQWNGTAVGRISFLAGSDTTNKDDGQIRFSTASGGTMTEAMRIKQDGVKNFGAFSGYSGGHNMYSGAASASDFAGRFDGVGSGSGNFLQFVNAYGQIGGVTFNAGTTYFNTTSDYRLKENDIPIVNGITRVKQLKPIRFNWKANKDLTVDGFIAHEVSPVVPEAVIGEKDATQTTYYGGSDTIPEGKKEGDVKEENAILPQQLDASKLIPVLTAALQEAIAKIETLETKVAALEAA